MRDFVTKDMIYKAMQVNLLSYAQGMGMEFESRGSSDTLYWKGHSLNITQSKNKWYQFSTQKGGNVINFVMEFQGKSFQEAVRILCGEDIQNNLSGFSHSQQNIEKPSEKEKLVLPKRNDNAQRVFAYLVKTRRIDPEIISKMMKEKKIYENDKHSCVFVGYDENNEAGYASVRSTYTMGNAFKGDVKNSNKKYSFTMNGKSNTVYVFEAPIDAMSHASLVKLGSGDWSQDWRISLGGISDQGLSQFLSTHKQIKNICFATDNDEQGEAVLNDTYNPDGSIRSKGYINKYKDMGYNVHREKSNNKDWNEDLTEIKEMIEKAELEQSQKVVGEEDLEL